MFRDWFSGLALMTGILLHGTLAPAASPVYGDVAAILQARCVICHAGPAAPLGLQLDSYGNILAGSRNGSVVSPGDSEGSELVRRIKGLSLPRMPMTGPPFLDDQAVVLIEGWIDSGAPYSLEVPAARAEPAPQAPSSAKGPLTFAEIAPLLAARCVKCHTDDGLMGPAPEGYRLTSYAAALSAADRVRIVPGHPATSELVRRITGQSRPRMPYDGPPFLDEQEVNRIAAWVAGGARTPEGQPASYPLDQRLRLQGHLVDLWQLDGEVRLYLSHATRRDKVRGVGDYVEVRGRLLEDGAVAVERIRRR